MTAPMQPAEVRALVERCRTAMRDYGPIAIAYLDAEALIAIAEASLPRPIAEPTERPYWISWYAFDGAYELHSPWWNTGYRCEDDVATICAAVMAESEDAAKALIIAAHDDPKPADLDWRFCEPRNVGWSPFSSRFPPAKWMQWPLPVADQEERT